MPTQPTRNSGVCADPSGAAAQAAAQQQCGVWFGSATSFGIFKIQASSETFGRISRDRPNKSKKKSIGNMEGRWGWGGCTCADRQKITDTHQNEDKLCSFENGNI